MTHANFVKHAQKDYPESDIKKGDPYWWWSFRFGGLHRSKTQPRSSQLTQSGFYSALFDIEDSISALSASGSIAEDIEGIKSDIESLKEETDEKLNNMPDGLKEGDTGQLLQERIDGLDSWISEIDGIDTDVDENLSEDEKQERYEEILQEFQETSHNL